MIRRTADYFVRLPRHPFKLARALITAPIPNYPRVPADLPAWTERCPILIVHNNGALLATGLHALLRREGWRALICSEGAGALAIGQAAPISLIIVDDNLEDLSPIRLIYDLYDQPATHTTPIILLTSTRQPSRPLPSHAEILYKPLNLGALAGLVSRMMLDQGNWRLPPGYRQDRAERILKEFVYAR